MEFALRLELKAFSLCGEPILDAGFQENAHLTSREIISPDAFAYGEPDENTGVWESSSHSGTPSSHILVLSRTYVQPVLQILFPAIHPCNGGVEGGIIVVNLEFATTFQSDLSKANQPRLFAG